MSRRAGLDLSVFSRGEGFTKSSYATFEAAAICILTDPLFAKTATQQNERMNMPTSAAKPCQFVRLIESMDIGRLIWLALFLVFLTPRVRAGDYNYTTNNGALRIIDYTGPGGDVTVPASINGLEVQCIAEYAFIHCVNVTSITIPDTVTTIKGLAFSYCTGLKNVALPNSVTNIGEYAFVCCSSLKSVTIPNGITTIADSTFQYCTNLSSVILGQGVNQIGSHAFDGCSSLVSIAIPGKVTSIGDSALQSCTSLTNVTMATGLSRIGRYAYAYCSSLTSLTFPDSVASLGDSACEGCASLTRLTIGNGVTNIGSYAFAGCSGLTCVTVPQSVAGIGCYAFGSCAGLRRVHFNGNMPKADSTVFAGDPYTTAYYLPGSCGWNCDFGGCSAVLWDLQSQAESTVFGVSGNQFGFKVTGPSKVVVVVVETCTNLTNPVWCPSSTIYLNGGSSFFNDPEWTKNPNRFYRIRPL